MAVDDGGPAYPTTSENYSCYGDRKGMTVRDRFTLAALPFCLEEFGGNATDQTQYAEAAYQIADAMLVEREKGKV